MSENIKPLPSNTLVVVADGTGARLFRVHRDGTELSLKESAPIVPDELADGGPAGARPPEQTAQQTDEATFAKQLANKLYKKVHSGGYDDLVLIADPQTLGQLRGSLHQEVTDRLRREIPKTLTNSSISDIEKQIS